MDRLSSGRSRAVPVGVLLCVVKADAAGKSDRAISLILNCNWIWLVLFRVHPEDQHPTLKLELLRAIGYSMKLWNREARRKHPLVVQLSRFPTQALAIS